MNKVVFLETLRAKHAEWEALLDEVGEERMTTPGVEGEWSIKDIIAHVAWNERELVGVFATRALVGSDLWNISTDARNAVVFEQNRHRSLQDVLAEEQQVYAQLLEGAQTLSDEDLNDPQRFKEMLADWIPWQIFAGNSFKHYDEHIRSIRARLDRGQL